MQRISAEQMPEVKNEENLIHLNRYVKFINSRTGDFTGDGELHHIIPKSFGGSNKKDNKLYLSIREHFIAHLLLWKAYRGKMAQAFHQMCFSKRFEQNLSSRQYEVLKKDTLEARQKKVICFSKNSYRIFNSIIEGARVMNANAGYISDCCKEKQTAFSSGRDEKNNHLFWRYYYCGIEADLPRILASLMEKVEQDQFTRNQKRRNKIRTKESRLNYSISKQGKKNPCYGKIAHNAKNVYFCQNGELTLFSSLTAAAKGTDTALSVVGKYCRKKLYTTDRFWIFKSDFETLSTAEQKQIVGITKDFYE